MTLPANLYAYTDSSATQTTYYCFCDFNYAPSDGYPLYVDTLTNPTVLYKKGQHAGSPTPTFLPASENIISFDGTTLVWDDMDHIDSGSSTRYPQEDVTLGNPTTIYTDTTNLSVGQMLYTNEGVDSGFVIDTLNQDGSFTIASTASFNFTMGSNISSYTIDSTVYTTNQQINLTDGVHTLSVAYIDFGTGYTTVINRYYVGNGTMTVNVTNGTLTITDATFTTSDTLTVDWNMSK